MLGEVLRCVEVDDAFHLGVRLFNSISGVSDLGRLNRRLIQEEAPARAITKAITKAMTQAMTQ